MKKFLVMMLACVLPISIALAADADFDEQEKRIRQTLKVYLPNLIPDTVADSKVPGLYELTFGPRVVYVAGEGRYLLQGKVIDLETREDMTDSRSRGLRMDALESLGEDKMIVYSPKEKKHTITVFTDIDCGYCRKLHAEMGKYNDAGIEVRYLFYPRAGIGSKAYDKAVSVWCADDRRHAMDIAKAGELPAARKCENPVAEEYELGQSFGISGTPAIILEDGDILPGYVPASRLAKALDQAKAEQR